MRNQALYVHDDREKDLDHELVINQRGSVEHDHFGDQRDVVPFHPEEPPHGNSEVLVALSPINDQGCGIKADQADDQVDEDRKDKAALRDRPGVAHHTRPDESTPDREDSDEAAVLAIVLRFVLHVK